MAPLRRQRYTELFDLIDSVLADADVPATQAAQSAAAALGLPWRYTASTGHLDVCLDATRPCRYLRWLPWPHRGFTSLGRSYVCVTDRYGGPGFLGRVRPLMHEYSWR